jgi:predicted Zn-dependent protease
LSAYGWSKPQGLSARKDFMRPLAKLLLSTLAASLTVATGYANAQVQSDLPEIGNPAAALISVNEERQIGEMIVRQLRDQNRVIDDPEVDEYVQSLGLRLASQASDPATRHFQYFTVREAGINAFALPGGFIGVNYGTILASHNESELASVLAHETAHVTQRHIAREINAQSKQGLVSAATILAAILIGAAGGGSAMEGAIAAAQGASIQQQINFTRTQEYEADRVGIGFLASAGFDPNAMANFFEALSRQEGLNGAWIPEMLRDHPVTGNRVAEARGRAAQYERRKVSQSVGYSLIKERLRVLTTEREQLIRLYTEIGSEHEPELDKNYGRALTLMAIGRPAEAVRILVPLVERHQGNTLLYGALGQAQMAAHEIGAGLATFEHALALFPRNVPLSIRYAEGLMSAGRAEEAYVLLIDLFNNIDPTTPQIRLTAMAASAAGDAGDAYFYMSEFHISNGDLLMSVQQLQLALTAPNLTVVQKERYQARLDEIRDYLATARMQRTSNNQ